MSSGGGQGLVYNFAVSIAYLRGYLEFETCSESQTRKTRFKTQDLVQKRRCELQKHIPLSKGVTGISPQSRIVYGEVYGFRPRRGLKPRKEV